MIYKAKNEYFTEYIDAPTMQEARAVFNNKHSDPAETIEPTKHKRVHAVYFTDSPTEPAWFNGTKADALKAARLYIRQWQLDAKIDRVETVTASKKVMISA